MDLLGNILRHVTLRLVANTGILIIAHAFLMSNTAVATEQNMHAVELDVQWGRGNRIDWNGKIDISQGKILAVEGYGLEPGETARKVSDQEVIWKSITAGYLDGVKITVDASPDTIITITTPIGIRRAYIREVIKRDQKWRLDSDNHQLEIRRSARDALKLVINPGGYVFQTGQRHSFSWDVNFGLKQKTNKLEYQLKITKDSTGATVWKSTAKYVTVENGLTARINESVSLPDKEGGYLIRLRIFDQPVDLRDSVTNFVVLNPKGFPAGLDEDQKMPLILVDQVDIAQATDSRRFRDSGDSHLVRTNKITYRESGSLAKREFNKKKTATSLSWFGYRLNIRHPGKPHILEVDYPKDKDRFFVIRLVEKAQGGNRGQNVLDVGVVSYGKNTVSGSAIGTKRIVFWPTTKHPAVAFINGLPGSAAALSGLRVYEAPNGLKANAGRLMHTPTPELRGPYFEEARLQRSLGGREVLDPASSFTTRPDWQTYYDAITHLCELLRYRGENAVMMVVYAYGATLYPSAILPNNGRYDDGIDFSDGRDPVQKDVIRLMLDLFERNHIKLIPTFAFYTRIPSLDKQFPPDSSGRREIDLINRNGENAQQVLKLKKNGNVGPFYNPTHPAVQHIISAAIDEFVNRYKDSAALGDIAIQLNTTGWTQFPGLNWGYDKLTIMRFAKYQNIDLATNLLVKNSYQERYHFLNSKSIRESWIKWRNLAIKDFFGKLANRIWKVGKNRKLVLAYMNTFTSRYADNNAVRFIRRGGNPRYLLSVKGIDPIEFSKLSHVRIWRPVRTAVPLVKRSQSTSIPSHSPETLALFKKSGADGIVNFYDYWETYVPGMQKNWWWKLDDWLVSTSLDPRNQVKLDATDKAYFYGGWQVLQ